MKKLIELDAALDALEGIDCSDGVGISTLKCDTVNDAITVIKALPTVDAVPVKHGRWIKKRYWSEGVGMGERYGYYYSCSKCGNWVRGGYDECGKKYCDECGARMDGKVGDNG